MIEDLNPCSQAVKIDGQEYFLREHLGARLDLYARQKAKAVLSAREVAQKHLRPMNASVVVEAARAALEAEGLSDEERMIALQACLTPSDLTAEGLEKAISEGCAATKKAYDEIFRWMLFGLVPPHDCDDLGCRVPCSKPTDAQLEEAQTFLEEKVSYSMRKRLLEIQDGLDHFEELTKNVRLLAVV